VAAYRIEGGVDLIDPALRNAIFWEVLVFLATLALGYVYAWRKGVFKWR
jgi:NADH-quinone oxidoreductase subunit A